MQLLGGGPGVLGRAGIGDRRLALGSIARLAAMPGRARRLLGMLCPDRLQILAELAVDREQRLGAGAVVLGDLRPVAGKEASKAPPRGAQINAETLEGGRRLIGPFDHRLDAVADRPRPL